MTNGEKIIAILKPRKDQIRIYDNWVEIEIQKLGINFSCELDWWNTECNEPSNKSIIYKAKESKEIQEDLNRLRKLNESTTKNDLGVDCVSRQAVDSLCWEYLRKATDENIAFYENFLDLPSVTPPQEPVLDEIRTEIEEQVLESLSDGGDDWFTAEKVNECLDIIDKYKAESEEICQN